MATILLVDDRQPSRDTNEAVLQNAGHTVTVIPGQRAEEFQAHLKDLFGREPDQFWDFLVLDLHFPNDEFGGIWLYNNLTAGLHHRRWKHTLMYSRFVSNDLENQTRGNEFIVRVFAHTARIPSDCFLNANTGSRKVLLDRITQLERQAREPHCPHCSRPL